MRSLLLNIILLAGGLFAMFSTSAQNIMSIKEYEAAYNDTIEVSIGIDNIEPFISFQCDVMFDEGLTFVEDSEQLTNRKNDHLLIGSVIGQGHLRFLSYSNSNAPFNYDTGDVMTFMLATSDMPGDHPLVLQDAIIGNVNSQNIITGTENGNIYMPGSYLNGTHAVFQCSLYPNPVNDHSKIQLTTSDKMVLEYLLANGNGQVLSHGPYRYKGNNTIRISEILSLQTCPPGFYFLHLNSGDGKIHTTLKIIIAR